MQHVSSGGFGMDLRYGYDEMNNRLFSDEAISSVPPPNDPDFFRQKVFTYDSLYRVKRTDYGNDLSALNPGDRIDPTDFYASSATHEIFNMYGVNNRLTRFKGPDGLETVRLVTSNEFACLNSINCGGRGCSLASCWQ